MSTVTIPTKRFRNPTRPSSRGKIRAKNWNVNFSGKTFSPPDKFERIVFQNSGLNDVQLSFNDDTEWWTLKAGDKTPILWLNDSVTVNMKTASAGLSSTVEAVMWG